MSQIDLRRLRVMLDEYLGSDDVRTLCFSLSIQYDNLAGATKNGRIESLITHYHYRDQMDELLAALHADRPDLDDLVAKLYGAEEVKPPVVAKATIIEAYEREIKTLTQYLHRGRLLLVLGADLPEVITAVPSRETMANALARQEGIEPQASLAAVAQQVMQFGNRFTFTQFIREQLDTTGKEPQAFHRYVAGLVRENDLDMVVTMAYDILLETIFRNGGVSLSVVVNDTDLQFAPPGQPMLLKLYGDAQQPTSLIVTEQDQNALLNGRNQDKQEMMSQMKFALRRQAVLFVGYDLTDTAVNVLFDAVNAQQFQQPAFAIWSGCTEREKQAWQSNRGLTILDAEPATFLKVLLDA